MNEMTSLLNESVEIIKNMGDAHGKQTEVIKNTVQINQDIANSFQNANEQFHSINAMAESNAKDTTEVATQAGVINEMVQQMTALLTQEE